MKKFLILVLTLILLLNIGSTAVSANSDAVLIINGETQTSDVVKAVAINETNTQLIASVYALCSALDANYEVSGNNVTVRKGSSTLAFTAGNSSAIVNGEKIGMPTAPQLVDGTIFVSAEFFGEKLGYHIFRERAGKRVRIVSKTGVTAPALKQKAGMAKLVSEHHREVPKQFEKSNILTVDNLIFNKTDYSDAVGDSEIKPGPLPTGEVIFSQQDFLDEFDGLSHIQYNFSTVDVNEKYEANFIRMFVKMAGSKIGEGRNSSTDLNFTKAVRINSKFEIANAFAAKIEFGKRLPAPEKDDKYVLSYYARLVEGGDPDFGLGRISFSVYSGSGSSLEKIVEISPEWKRYDFLLTNEADANQIRFIGAHEKQIIEIGGFEVQNVGKDADVSYFSQTKKDLLPAELAPDAKWREDALERIEKVRKGDFKVVVKDKNGNPVPNANVELDMFEHEFKFGTTMDIEYVADSKFADYTFLDSNGNKYEPGSNNGNKDAEFRARVGANFNSMAVGNRLKWGCYAEDEENNPGLPSTASLVVDTAKELGVKYVRGHALWMPAVDSTMRKPDAMYDLLSGTKDDVEERYNTLTNGFITPHFARMNTEFPEIYEWDVTNETHGRFSFTNAFGMRIFNDIYRIAGEELTNGQGLVLCDNRQFEDQYWERLGWFKEQGIKYDTLGMQGHSRIGSYDYNNNFRPSKMLEVWDRFAYEYGKTFAVTEYSIGALSTEYGWEGQGDYTRDILIAAFSHPACTGFNFWWMADYWSEWDSPFRPDNATYGKLGAGVSPLYGLYFESKPGLKQYQDLLYNKWWTKDAKATTNSNGEGTVNGYYGDYDVTVTVGGKETKVMAAFHKGYENVLTVVIE